VKLWDAPDSIFAPIVAAVPPGTVWAGFANTLFAAERGLPRAAILYRVKRPGSFKTVNEIRERTSISYSGESAEPFSARARLSEHAKGSSPPGDAGATLWEVGLTHLKDGLCAPAVPEDWDSAILQTSTFRLMQYGLQGAPQLALIRHRWAEAIRAAAPGAIIFGGQRHWQDEWWNERVNEHLGE
jgi:hypothetical protein